MNWHGVIIATSHLILLDSFDQKMSIFCLDTWPSVEVPMQEVSDDVYSKVDGDNICDTMSDFAKERNSADEWMVIAPVTLKWIVMNILVWNSGCKNMTWL